MKPGPAEVAVLDEAGQQEGGQDDPEGQGQEVEGEGQGGVEEQDAAAAAQPRVLGLLIAVLRELQPGARGHRVAAVVVRGGDARSGDLDGLAAQPAPVLAAPRALHVVAPGELVRGGLALRAGLARALQQVARVRPCATRLVRLAWLVRGVRGAVCKAVLRPAGLAHHLRRRGVADLLVVTLRALPRVRVGTRGFEALVLADRVGIRQKPVDRVVGEERAAPLRALASEGRALDPHDAVDNERTDVAPEAVVAEHVVARGHVESVRQALQPQADLAHERGLRAAGGDGADAGHGALQRRGEAKGAADAGRHRREPGGLGRGASEDDGRGEVHDGHRRCGGRHGSKPGDNGRQEWQTDHFSLVFCFCPDQHELAHPAHHMGLETTSESGSEASIVELRVVYG